MSALSSRFCFSDEAPTVGPDIDDSLSKTCEGTSLVIRKSRLTQKVWPSRWATELRRQPDRDAYLRHAIGGAYEATEMLIARQAVRVVPAAKRIATSPWQIGNGSRRRRQATSN